MNSLPTPATAGACGHSFCEECVDKWRGASGGMVDASGYGDHLPCPTCRGCFGPADRLPGARLLRLPATPLPHLTLPP